MSSMENLYLKQEYAYGCGMYAVANSLNLHTFCTDERLEESKKGNRIGQLSNWLQDDGLNINIDVLWYDHHGKQLPEHFFEYTVTQAQALPLLFNVRFCDEGKNHLIAGRLLQSGELLLFDSLKEEPVITTLKEINNLYHHVYGMFLFMYTDTGDYVFLN